MKIENYQFPESSFLAMKKDTALIVEKMLDNERLKKLLFYMDKNCTSLPNLTPEQSYSLINKNIKIIPKLSVDDEELAYVIISHDNFSPSANPQFRDNIISFDIVCHFDTWNLGDFGLRPYEIAGEIDSMFNNKHLSGIGTLQFIGANQIVLNDELAGLALLYRAVHGKEDRV